jgi:hypothetical protein
MMLRFRIAVAAMLALVMLSGSPALAWDAKTHREITQLAIEKLPPSPLKDFFVANQAHLLYYSVEPDVLREKYGDESEAIRHYINLEYFGPNPFPALVPDLAAMNKRFGISTVRRAGTLPWTIEQFSDALKQAWSRGDCAEVLRLAGFLAHYVGDASQPLHTTVHFDGYEGDRGVHMRIERAVDDSARMLGDAAAGHIQLLANQTPWLAAIEEIRASNSHVDQLLQADRAARSLWPRNRSEYDRALLSRTRAILVDQIALAASVLTSIWLMEWKQAGPGLICTDPAGYPAASAIPR